MRGKCTKCDDELPQYGVGPHICLHKIPSAKVGQSINTFSAENWPDGFLLEVMEGDTPESLMKGCSVTGIYYCTSCDDPDSHARKGSLLTKEMFLDWCGEHQPREEVSRDV